MKVAVIPARGGSKRIPRKNIRPFLGKPIMAYSIEAARQCAHFDRIIVSTDDADVARVARDCGAEAPFVRPPELSNDTAGTTAVVGHTVEWLHAQGQRPAEVCCIYATAPLIRSADLSEAYVRLTRGGHDYVFSATTFGFPIQRALRLLKGDATEPMFPEHIAARSQDLEPAIHDAAQFYWGRADAFAELRPIFSRRSAAFLLPRWRVQDIDTPEDWDRAELMYRALAAAR